MTAAPENSPSRYVVGLDLGTTNSAVGYVDSLEAAWRVRTFPLPQLTAPGTVEARETLPSFHYHAAAGEFPPGALRLPWSSNNPDTCVGALARDHGGAQHGRLIASAKSWLCHTGVDRTADLLPWHGASDVPRLSPVEVSARYLRHVRAAWDAAHPADPLAAQDFVVTLPASFDEVARELTVAAAARAGLPRVVLIEEPQAAFYAWLNRHRDAWEREVQAGQTILVCDIGGGTSDFTLIRARGGEGGRVHFQRVAVGEHLILGGDNLDLALAKTLEPRLAAGSELAAGGELLPRQWDTLVRACRRVKETLLGSNAPERMTVNLAGGGSRLLGGGQQIDVTRAEVEQTLIEGFLPRCRLEDRPAARRSGFQEFGLPYAADAAMTRYLAAFLTSHRAVLAREMPDAAHDPARPDVVLFNGGFFHSPALRERLIEVLCSWFNSDGKNDWRPRVLDHERLDLAVAHGAAYYGMVLRGHGVRIAADLARTYYLGVEGGAETAAPVSAENRATVTETVTEENDAATPALALCVAPANAEPGQEIVVPRDLSLLVSQPVEFPLYVSSTRLTDLPGEVLPVEREQFTALAPIRTVLQARGMGAADRVPVRLHARLSEIGTLELWCAESAGSRRWKMQFDVRSATQTDRAAHGGAAERGGFVEESVAEACAAEIVATFGTAATAPLDTLAKRLSAAAAISRSDWPPALLRRMWQTLLEVESGRRRSPQAEARWLNLLGYALRPGYGLALDDWRVAETWRLLNGKLAHAAAHVQNEWWILWRRLAGGLTAGQQIALANPLFAPLRALHKRLTTGKGGGGDLSFATGESVEVWRLLGSLELLSPPLKLELGRMVLDLLPKKKLAALRPALLWTLGRVAARVPVYGPLNVVPAADAAEKWLTELAALKLQEPLEPWVLMQLARKTGDRYRDLSSGTRSRILEVLKGRDAPEHFLTLVEQGGELDIEEQTQAFGEALPRGLRIG